MSEVSADTNPGDPNGVEHGTPGARRAARRLSLAAAPAFALMALLTASDGSATAGLLCSVSPAASPLSGMTAMYVLMSVFHSAPWLSLISGGRRGGRLQRRTDG